MATVQDRTSWRDHYDLETAKRLGLVGESAPIEDRLADAPMGATASLLNIRLFHNKAQRLEQLGLRLDAKVSPHISPFSTVVYAMGTYWEPGCLEAVRDMVLFTHAAGYEVGFYEERDRCFQPFDAIGTMRNVAYMRAIEQGWEYLLYIDNDVRPPKDALVRLLQRRVPIISPIVSYADGQAHNLDMPKMERNRGLALCGSTVLSFLLCKTSVFSPWATGGFWGNAIGDDEEVHFLQWATVGHQPFVDTDVEVVCLNAPHFPLDEVLEQREAMHHYLWIPPKTPDT